MRRLFFVVIVVFGFLVSSVSAASDPPPPASEEGETMVGELELDEEIQRQLNTLQTEQENLESRVIQIERVNQRQQREIWNGVVDQKSMTQGFLWPIAASALNGLVIMLATDYPGIGAGVLGAGLLPGTASAMGFGFDVDSMKVAGILLSAVSLIAPWFAVGLAP